MSRSYPRHCASRPYRYPADEQDQGYIVEVATIAAIAIAGLCGFAWIAVIQIASSLAELCSSRNPEPCPSPLTEP
jgi:hypothetical protein